MLKLFRWLRREHAGGRKNGTGRVIKPAGGGKDTTKTGRTAVAAKVAEKRWGQDGERADQDYYHVPGGGNPDRTDPPKLHGEQLGKPEKKKPAAKKTAAKPRKRKPAKGQGGGGGGASA
jgi:hypothetical protein